MSEITLPEDAQITAITNVMASVEYRLKQRMKPAHKLQLMAYRRKLQRELEKRIEKVMEKNNGTA